VAGIPLEGEAMKYGRIVGWGKYVPDRVLTNFDLERMVDTSDEWIVTRTGIRERRIAGEGETTASMSVTAARRALEVAGIRASDIELIVVASSSPDYLVPPVSSMIQDRLGAQCGAFTLAAGCTGFVYGLATAQQFIASGVYRRVLVIGAETISRNIDWTDRNTCVLFGDGAGAVVLQASDTPTGVLSFVLGSDGSGAEHLIVPGGGVALPMGQRVVDERAHYLRMNGREVFKFATRVMARAAIEAVEQAGLTWDDVDLLIPHQANARIIELAARQLGVPMDKVFVNLDRYGNTSAASIPVALVEAIEQGRCTGHSTVVMVGFGAGLTWAAAVVRMGEREHAPYALWRTIPGRARARARLALNDLSMRAGALLMPLYARVTRR
jgi:3-oxoacyl-[acyl-carrier-protein] synthase-3